MQDIDTTNAALDQAYDEAMASVAESDEQRGQLEKQTESIQEDAPVVKAKAAPKNTYGWWEVNQIQLKSKPAEQCISAPNPEYEVPQLEAPEKEGREHFADMCSGELRSKKEKKTKEKAAKELKTKRCEVAGKSAKSASAKSENLNKKLEKSFKEAKELKKKLGETNKENEKKLEKKKQASELASKEVVSDSAREKCYKGWEKHIKKEKALKEADLKRKLAEEKKCKADDAEKKVKGKGAEGKKKKAAEVAAKDAAKDEKKIKESAMKKAKEACKKGEYSDTQKSFEERNKVSAEKTQKAATLEEKAIKERAAKNVHSKKKVVVKPSESTHKTRCKETVVKMRHLRTALEDANELYAKTSSGQSEKKEKCKDAVEKSEKKLEKQKERVKKASEAAKKDLKTKKEKATKEKEHKATEAADPYNQAELISKSVLKMKAMYHSEKEKESKSAKATKEACDKKYKKLEDEGHSKESKSKAKLNALDTTMKATIEKAEKTQCKKTLKSSELSNKAEEKFWSGKIAELNANVAKCEKQGAEAQKKAIHEVCEAAAEDVVAAMAKSTASVMGHEED